VKLHSIYYAGFKEINVRGLLPSKQGLFVHCSVDRSGLVASLPCVDHDQKLRNGVLTYTEQESGAIEKPDRFNPCKLLIVFCVQCAQLNCSLVNE
jgi:hypothetical protein